MDSACDMIGISSRTVQRWRRVPDGEDGRIGPRRVPGNKLSEGERKEVLQVANSPQYKELSPKQIVPQLADTGRYVASESSFYRILQREGQVTHRELGRYLVCVAGQAGDLSGILNQQISRDIATAQRLRRCLEKLGGWPEWSLEQSSELELFYGRLTENQVRARLLGKEIDAALEDPRWLADVSPPSSQNSIRSR